MKNTITKISAEYLTGLSADWRRINKVEWYDHLYYCLLEVESEGSGQTWVQIFNAVLDSADEEKEWRELANWLAEVISEPFMERYEIIDKWIELRNSVQWDGVDPLKFLKRKLNNGFTTMDQPNDVSLVNYLVTPDGILDANNAASELRLAVAKPQLTPSLISNGIRRKLVWQWEPLILFKLFKFIATKQFTDKGNRALNCSDEQIQELINRNFYDPNGKKLTCEAMTEDVISDLTQLTIGTPNKVKLEWEWQANTLAALFFDLTEIKDSNKKCPLVKDVTAISEFICSNFLIRVGERRTQINVSTVRRYLEKDDKLPVYINDTQYFDNVPEVAWEFYIGGYQPAQKWLKDRKERKLEFDDILHYQKIIVALKETDRLMKEIDKIEF